MIKGTFSFGGNVIEVVVDNNNLMFLDVNSGLITTVDGLKFDKTGVLKEFPDLKDEENWKKISLERFKEHFNQIIGETNKLNYVKEELTKSGYLPLMKQRAGFRPTKFN